MCEHLCVCVCSVQSLSRVPLFVTPRTAAHQAPLSAEVYSPGKDTGVRSHSLLQGIFPTQGSSPGLLHGRQIFYCLSHREAYTVSQLNRALLQINFSNINRKEQRTLFISIQRCTYIQIDTDKDLIVLLIQF